MFVEELGGVVVVVGDDRHGSGGSFEDYGSLGAPDVVVVAVVRCAVWVDPALGFGVVELQAEGLQVVFEGVCCVGQVVGFGEYVDVVHVGSYGRGGFGWGEVVVGFGEGGVEGEGEGGCGQRASHGYSACRGEGESFLVGEVAVVLCLGCDPGADQGLEVGVVCLYGVDDGVVVNVAEGSLDVD